MSTPQFTPGDWVARNDRTIAADGVPLLRLYAGRNEQANADLIVTAPKLYDRLENLLIAIAIGMGWDLDGVAAEAQLVMSQARGELP